ncbi:LysE family translocator [Psychrobium sp. 1_MG-2023]|uniref:LysE family translocator n=1 Tax=Psychrobium sp. 1_MG-2023 TaxID=3062624 RepID=UPI002732F79A|nr:LysE family translocator [Psychrobium sp. 1_MG-2023]MDP2562462.1 LysE family translocator [Psychrobium sp. 1_MG-2023]
MIDPLFFSQFAVLATAHFLAVASPGPDLAVVLKQSVSYGRRHALVTSVGIGLAILVHVSYSVLGIGLLIKQSELLFSLLKYLCAGYLTYIGIQALRAKPSAPQTRETNADASLPAQPITKAFGLGFITNVLNPKATLFFLSVFSVVLSAQTPMTWMAGYAVYLSLATMAWFCMISVVLSRHSIRQRFLASGYIFDRVMGVILILLGVNVAFSQLV